MRHVAITAALALIAVAAPVSAASSVETLSVSVNYADLELSTPVGMKTLDGRIRRAVQTICPAPVDSRGFGPKAAWESCVQEAMTSAQQQLAALKGKGGTLVLRGKSIPVG